MSSEASTEDQYLFALQDILARMDLTASAMMEAVSGMMNAITNLNNTKNYYLKLIGQIQIQQKKNNPISSK